MKVFEVETKVRVKNSGSGLVCFQDGVMVMPGEEKDISLLLLSNPEKVANNYKIGMEVLGLVVGDKLVKLCSGECDKPCADCPAKAPAVAPEPKVEEAKAAPQPKPEAAPEPSEKPVAEEPKTSAKRGK